MIRAKDDFELRTFDTKWPDTAIAVETMRQELAAIRERFCPGASLQEVLESIDKFIADIRRLEGENAELHRRSCEDGCRIKRMVREFSDLDRKEPADAD